jgi:hypothetical protein
MEASREELLEELHKLTTQELIDRIQGGEASPADLSVAVRFLKDNGIECGRNASQPLYNLADIVPFPTGTKDDAAGTA